MLRKHFRDHYKTAFLKKDKNWLAECEYRWLVNNEISERKPEPAYVTIKGALIRVIVGFAFPEVYEICLRELCKQLKVPAGKINWQRRYPVIAFKSIYAP